MFFIWGINSKRKDLNISDLKICGVCGAYGRYEGFVDYQNFNLFFIPLISWGEKYYIRSTCCGSIFAISQELGKEIENGRVTKINDEDLTLVQGNYSPKKICSNCGQVADADFEYCPKCGTSL